MKKDEKRTEGDINDSENRKIWQDKHLSEKTKKLLKEDEKYFMHQALSTPCLNVAHHAEGIYIVDEDGRKIMDFHGNSVHQLGYNHPVLLEAMKQQIDKLSFSPRRYTNEAAVELAKKLCSYFPKKKYKVLYTTSGAASNEIALKMVRKATGKYKVVSMWDSFHGANIATISVGGTAHFRNGMGPLLEGMEHILPYNSYRCMFGECKNCGLKCLEYLEYILKRENDIGAVLMEPIRCTDVQIPPKEYYKRLRELCDQYEVKLIFDEVPTAFGRTGTMFAFQNYDILPDILVLGKGIGGGLVPFSAVVARSELDVCEDTSLGHYTHEKNPIASAIALALIRYIEEDHLLDHVAEISDYMEKRANSMQKKYQMIGDVRKIGALMAIELVKNRETKEKASEEAERVMYYCLEKGLSFKVSQGNVLTLEPPLIISLEELMHAMDILENAFGEIIV
ncbi:MAG: aspartate aminotransferase family protein [Lachnospiraceae bacterium]|nr:aspartate aminotransferase family protein [Lachnospiraceae bacterium]